MSAYLPSDRVVTETRFVRVARRGRAVRVVEVVAHVALTWGCYSKSWHRSHGPSRTVESVEAVVRRTKRDGSCVVEARVPLSRAELRHALRELAARGYAVAS